MSEENKEKGEPTAAEKLQAEYNQLISLLGHNMAQRLSMRNEYRRLMERMEKLMNKASNIPKKEVEAVKEPSGS